MQIQHLLSSLSSDWGLSINGSRAFIRCPFHRKNGKLERTPSFVINVHQNEKAKAGCGHCFGCGKNASWKEIAKALKISGNIEFDMSTEPHKKKTKQQEITLIAWDPAIRWRGISGKLMSYLGTDFFTRNNVDWARIPVVQNKEQLGWIDARVNRESKDVKAYINKAGEWTKHALFGFDLAKKYCTDCVVVVEGPRDALHLLQHKIPAVAVLGASNVNKFKVELLLANWSIVVSGFDPDSAGQLAAEKLEKLVGKRALFRHLEFEEGTDPADMTKDDLQKLKRMLAI